MPHSLRALCALTFLVAASCARQADETAAPPVVEVVASYDARTASHLFTTETTSVPSGWTTIRLVNASPVAHFIVVQRLPAGKTVAHSAAEIVPVFQQAMDLINVGQVDSGMAHLAGLPAWFSEVTFHGGPGLVSPGGTAEVTVELAPGDYVLECYVKTGDGTFHSARGMLIGLHVTEERSAALPPQATLSMRLNNSGFHLDGPVTAGRHTVAVYFDEPDPPLLGNDVHVIRLGEDGDPMAVAAWMDWSHPSGLVWSEAAGQPFEGLGGTHEGPHGSTAYFTVDLAPGRYAWVSERPASMPLFHEFRVTAP